MRFAFARPFDQICTLALVLRTCIFLSNSPKHCALSESAYRKSQLVTNELTTVHSYGSGEPGRPPCERCIREQHECILGGSRRGGKRTKRAHSQLEQIQESTSTAGQDIMSAAPTATNPAYQSPARPMVWPNYSSESQPSNSAPSEPRQQRVRNDSSNESTTAKMRVDESIASADIQNPSDALEFLANVADRAEGRMLPPLRSSLLSGSPSQQTSNHSGQPTPASATRQLPVVEFAPLQKGYMSLEMIHELLNR